MGKKVVVVNTQAPRRLSTRTIKKTERPQDEQFYEEDDSPENSSSHLDRDENDDQENSDENGSGDDDGEGNSSD